MRTCFLGCARKIKGIFSKMLHCIEKEKKNKNYTKKLQYFEISMIMVFLKQYFVVYN